MKNKTKTMGLLAIFVILAALIAIDGLATLTITPAAGSGLNDSATGINISSDELVNITTCNLTITPVSSSLLNSSMNLNVSASEDYVGTINSINMSGLYGLSGADGFDWSTLIDGEYQISSVVCLNITGDDSDNQSGTQNFFIDFTTPSTAVLNTTEDTIFNNKEDVEIIIDTTSFATGSQCVIVFEGGKFPNDPSHANAKEWTFNVSGTNSTCVATWDERYLPDGIYRYTAASFDGYNISANSSFREFRVEEGKAGMSNYVKAQQLKEAGYTSLKTSTGTLDLTTFALFDAETLTSNQGMIALLILGVIGYLLFFKKKK